jgi:hypothetical protein
MIGGGGLGEVILDLKKHRIRRGKMVSSHRTSISIAIKGQPASWETSSANSGNSSFAARENMVTKAFSKMGEDTVMGEDLGVTKGMQNGKEKKR